MHGPVPVCMDSPSAVFSIADNVPFGAGCKQAVKHAIFHSVL